MFRRYISSSQVVSGLKKQLQSIKGPVVVDFYADWCGPCRMIGPILEKQVAENKKVKLLKVDVDADQESAQEFNITALPTVVGFKDGKPVDQFVGLRNAEFIKEFLHKISKA